MAKDLLTITQAAVLVGAHKPQIYRLIDSGYLPCHEEGGVKKVQRQEFMQKWESRPRRETKPRMSGAKKPKPPPSADPPSKPARSSREGAKTGPTPDYNAERAWTEFERNREIRLKNEMLEGKLVYKEDIERAYQAIFGTMLARAYEVAKQVKLRVPSVTYEDMEIIEQLVLDVFEQVSETEFVELDEVEND